jgi:hypothetical protein
MGAGVQGLRGSGSFGTDVRPTNYREYYTFLEPNGNAPLNALLAMGSSESTNDSKFNNFQDELPDRVITVNGAIASTSTGTITVDSSDQIGFFIAGALVTNATTGEVMHVTADASGTTLTVSRNIGGTSHQIADGASLFVSGFAAAEGSGAPSAVSFDPQVDFNYTQIFKMPFAVTGTMQNTYTRTGDKEAEYQDKALKLHMQDIERAHFFGYRHELNGSSNSPTRFTGGLMNLITTNVFDVSTAISGVNGTNGKVTEDEFDALLINTIFGWGGKEKIAFVGPTVATHLQAIAKDRWAPTQVEGSYGVNLTRYNTFSGDLLIHLHPQFRQIPGMATAMVILDFQFLKYRYLENRDTHLQENIQDNDADAVEHQWFTDCGLELQQDKPHAVIKGWATK